MTASLWIRDLAAYGGQVALVIAAGAMLARLFRIDSPRAALVYWRALLFACLLLPVLQPWQPASPVASTVAIGPPIIATTDAAGDVPAPVPGPVRWPVGKNAAGIALGVVAAGVTIRLLWLIAAAMSLRRLRQRAVRLVPLPPAIETARTRVGALADVYVSDQVAGPITFGAVRPVVILPPSVLTMDARIQEAIACHELLHVRRHDWLDEIFEEGVRTIFWCHPAMWWLIARIQLTREQVVDRAVIDLTDARDSLYVDALLSVALSERSPALVPAPLFLRRGLLKRRIARIFEEHTMTTRRLIASLAASAAVLAVAATMAVRTFPLEARAQGVPGGVSGGVAGGVVAPVRIVKGGDHLLHGELTEYPRRAMERGIEGDVLLELTLDDQGQVSDARVLSGPDELRKAALEAVLNWHYAPSALRSTSAQVTLHFNLQAARASEGSEREFRAWAVTGKKYDVELTPTTATQGKLVEIEKALADPTTTPQQEAELKAMLNRAREEMGVERYTISLKALKGLEGSPVLREIRTERVSDGALREIMTRAGVRVGDPITEETARRITAAIAGIDEHISVVFTPTRGGVILKIVGP